MAYIVMAYTVMAQIVMAYVVMALYGRSMTVSCDKARRLLGYTPLVPVDEAIRRTLLACSAESATPAAARDARRLHGTRWPMRLLLVLGPAVLVWALRRGRRRTFAVM